jgi:hypothetical protein
MFGRKCHERKIVSFTQEVFPQVDLNGYLGIDVTHSTIDRYNELFAEMVTYRLMYIKIFPELTFEKGDWVIVTDEFYYRRVCSLHPRSNCHCHNGESSDRFEFDGKVFRPVEE